MFELERQPSNFNANKLKPVALSPLDRHSSSSESVDSDETASKRLPSAAKLSNLGLRLHDLDSAMDSSGSGFHSDVHSPTTGRSHIFQLLINLLSKDVSHTGSIAFTIMTIVIDFLQLLSFALLPSAGFAWYSPAVSWIQRVLNPFRLNQVAGGYDSPVPVYLALTAVAVLISLVAFLLYALSQNDVEYIWAIQPMRVIAVLVCFPFFIPIINAFTLQLPCVIPSSACFSNSNAVLAVLSMIAGFLLVVFCVVLTATFFTRDPLSEHPFARASSRVVVAQLLIRLVLTVSFPLLQLFPSLKWIMVLLFLIGCALMAAVYTFFLPLYNQTYNIVRVCEYWVLTWVSVCLVMIQSINDDRQSGLTALMFLMMPACALMGYFVSDRRRQHLLHAHPDELNSPEEFELKSRFLMAELIVQLRESSHDKHAPPSNANPTADAISPEEIQTIIQESESVYNIGCTRFPCASMFLLRAQFHFYFQMENTLAGLSDLNRAERCNPAFDESFSIYYLRQRQEEKFASGNSNREIIGFIEFNKCIGDARKFEHAASRAQLRFWEQLLEPTPDMSKLIELSSRIDETIVAARKAYRRLLTVQGSAPTAQVVRMYASFLSNVASDEAQSLNELKRAERIEEMSSKQLADSDSSNKTLLPNESTCSICISADAIDPGIITQINAACLRFMGYSRNEVIGSDMSMLLPAPFSESHSALFSEYLDSVQMESDDDIHQNRQLFVQHKNGLMSAVDVVIRQFITSSGSSFLALLALTSTTDHFAIISPQGMISSCTSGFAAMFALRPQQIATGAINVSAVIPDFVSKSHQLESPDGLLLSRTFEAAGVKAIVRMSNIDSNTSLMWKLLRASPVSGSIPISRTPSFKSSNSPQPESPAVPNTQRLSRVADGLLNAVGTPRSSSRLTPSHASSRSLSSGSGDLSTPIQPEINAQNEPSQLLSSCFFNQFGKSSSGSKSSLQAPARYDSTDLLRNPLFKAAPSRPLSISSGSPSSASPGMPPTRFSSSPMLKYSIVAASSPTSSTVPNSSAPLRSFRTDPGLGVGSASASPLIQSSLVSQPQRSPAGSRSPVRLPLHTPVSSSPKKSTLSSSHWLNRMRSQMARIAVGESTFDTMSRTRSLLIALVLFILAAALAQYFVVDWQVSSYSTSLSSLALATRRRSDCLMVASLTYELVLQNMGLRVPTSGRIASQQQLSDLASSMHRAYSAFQLDQVLPTSSAQLTLDTVIPVRFVQLQHTGSSFTYSISQHSMNDALQAFQSSAQRLSVAPLQTLTPDNPDVYFVTAHGPSVFLSALNSSTELYSSEASDSVTSLKWIGLACMLCPIVLTCVLMAFVGPVLTRLENQKNEILSQFLLVPELVVLDFQNKCVQHIRRLAEADPDLEPNGVHSPFDAEPEPSVAGSPVQKSSRILSRLASSSSAGPSISRQASSGSTDVNLQRISISQRSSSNSFSWRWLSVHAKNWMILFVVVLYFSITYWIDVGGVESLLRSTPLEINSAQMRSVYVQLSAFHLLRMATQNITTAPLVSVAPTLSVSSPLPGPFVMPVSGISSVLDALAGLDAFEHGLQYDSIAMSQAAQSSLMYSSACVPSSPSNCLQWQGGLMSLGLAPTVEHYMSIARSLTDSISATTSVNSTLQLPSMRFVREFERDYSPPVLQASLDAFTQAYCLNFRSMPARAGLLEGFIALVLLIYFVFYRPHMQRLNAEALRICSIFLLVPSDVLQNMSQTSDLSALLQNTMFPDQQI